MSRLVTKPNLVRHDDLYQRLIDVHADLGEADSFRLNARLVLILANHIGDEETIFEAIDLAAGGPGSGEPRDI
jgi:hypothetical protein